MNGVMDTEIKERRATQRRAREALGPSVAPDEVQDTAAERQTDKMMVAMNKKLKKQPGGATDVVHGTNNPASFPQFVENVFTAAFLVKDGHAGIVPSATGGAPTLSHTTPPATNANDRSSFVLHMDMGNWRRAERDVEGRGRNDADERGCGRRHSLRRARERRTSRRRSSHDQTRTQARPHRRRHVGLARYHQLQKRARIVFRIDVVDAARSSCVP